MKWDSGYYDELIGAVIWTAFVIAVMYWIMK